MRRSLEVQIHVERQRVSVRNARLFNRLDTFDWVLFTSKHAATFFTDELKERKVKLPKTIHIGAVGNITAQTLMRLGHVVTIIPEIHHTGKGLVESIGIVKGKKILFPRSRIAPFDTIHLLRKKGARVSVLPLYTVLETPLKPRTKRELLDGIYTELIFKSPSGVRGLLHQFSKNEQKCIKNIPCICIGPTTTQAAKDLGFVSVSTKQH